MQQDRNADQHTETSAERKPETENSKTKLGGVLGRFLQALTSQGWIANLIVGVALSLIFIAVTQFLSTPGSKVLAAGVGLTILLWVGIIAFYRAVHAPAANHSAERQEPPFAIGLDVVLAALDRDHGSGFWHIYKSIHGDTRSPANLALFMRITNLQGKPSMIEKLSIDVQNDGKWIRLNRLETGTGHVVFENPDQRKTKVVKGPDLMNLICRSHHAADGNDSWLGVFGISAGSDRGTPSDVDTRHPRSVADCGT